MACMAIVIVRKIKHYRAAFKIGSINAAVLIKKSTAWLISTKIVESVKLYNIKAYCREMRDDKEIMPTGSFGRK